MVQADCMKHDCMQRQKCARIDGCAAHSPLPAHVQVTAEVAQVCLALVDGMRGGLLGVGHSWVAGPGEAADPSSVPGSDAAAPVATAVVAAHRGWLVPFPASLRLRRALMALLLAALTVALYIRAAGLP